MASYDSQMSTIIEKSHVLGIHESHIAQAFAIILVLFPKGLASRGSHYVQYHVERLAWELLFSTAAVFPGFEQISGETEEERLKRKIMHYERLIKDQTRQVEELKNRLQEPEDENAQLESEDEQGTDDEEMNHMERLVDMTGIILTSMKEALDEKMAIHEQRYALAMGMAARLDAAASREEEMVNYQRDVQVLDDRLAEWNQKIQGIRSDWEIHRTELGRLGIAIDPLPSD